MNNFVPMNMIPFIANMKNGSEVKPGPQPGPEPTPFDPTELVHKFVFDFGHAEPTTLYPYQDCYELSVLPDEFMSFVLIMIPFRFTFNDKEYVIVEYSPISENDITEFVDVYADDINLTEHTTFEGYVITLHTDPETGDSVILLHKE